MRQHPVIGAEILGEHEGGMLQMARSIALAHHEQWDGSGYPAGLRGTDIPLAARIVAIADVFDALTSERPYKQAWPIERAVAFIEEQAGTHFDPGLLPAFHQALPQMLEIRAQFTDHPQPQA